MIQGMARDRNGLVVGATGLIGQVLLNQLLDDGTYSSVSVLTRRPTRRNHPRLVQRVTNFSDLDVIPISRVDVVFCALGTTLAKAGSKSAFRAIDYELPLRLANWAREKGAFHFLLVSSVGASPDARNFYLCVKGELERDIAAIGYPAIDIFQPSLLLGRRAETRPLETASKLPALLLQWMLVGKLSRYRPVRAKDVAAAMVEAARVTAPGVRRHEYASIIELARRLH